MCRLVLGGVSVGYRLLQAGQVPDAVKVFEANVQLYPDHANAFDSLGEGQMAAGNTNAAIDNYRKSLAMDPTNENDAAQVGSEIENGRLGHPNRP